MNAIVVPFEPAHLLALECRPSETTAFAALGGVDRAAAICDQGEYAYSVLVGERPIACIGVSRYWHGVGGAWAFMSPDACRWFKTIHGGVKMFLDGAFCDGEFHRIETVVHMGWPAAHRWALRLGFVPEGLKPMHGHDGADYMGYARTVRR